MRLSRIELRMAHHDHTRDFLNLLFGTSNISRIFLLAKSCSKTVSCLFNTVAATWLAAKTPNAALAKADAST
jgi:hypothetical protein